MDTMASQITSLTIVYSTIYSDADQRKHQSSVSLAFVWGIHRGPVNSPHKWPVTRKMFPFDDVIMLYHDCVMTWKYFLCEGNQSVKAELHKHKGPVMPLMPSLLWFSTISQTVTLPVIWDAMMLMCRPCKTNISNYNTKRCMNNTRSLFKVRWRHMSIVSSVLKCQRICSGWHINI